MKAVGFYPLNRLVGLLLVKNIGAILYPVDNSLKNQPDPAARRDRAIGDFLIIGINPINFFHVVLTFAISRGERFFLESTPRSPRHLVKKNFRGDFISGSGRGILCGKSSSS